MRMAWVIKGTQWIQKLRPNSLVNVRRIEESLCCLGGFEEMVVYKKEWENGNGPGTFL